MHNAHHSSPLLLVQSSVVKDQLRGPKDPGVQRFQREIILNIQHLRKDHPVLERILLLGAHHHHRLVASAETRSRECEPDIHAQPIHVHSRERVGQRHDRVLLRCAMHKAFKLCPPYNTEHYFVSFQDAWPILRQSWDMQFEIHPAVAEQGCIHQIVRLDILCVRKSNVRTNNMQKEKSKMSSERTIHLGLLEPEKMLHTLGIVISVEDR